MVAQELRAYTILSLAFIIFFLNLGECGCVNSL